MKTWPTNQLQFVLVVLCFVLGRFEVWAAGNERIKSFAQAKHQAAQIHADHAFTLYCNCKFSGKRVDIASCGYAPKGSRKRAQRLEWEHVVPAESFGQSFVEWRDGSPKCVRKGKRFKGRKCAEKNPGFKRMEADLYNLWPEIGELNGLRNNYSMAELGAEKSGKGDFGGCKAKIEDRKFEPMSFAKGRVARVYMYMEQTYPGHGIISGKNAKLFEAWDKLHPVDDWECERAKRIEAVQGNANLILKLRCEKVKKEAPVS